MKIVKNALTQSLILYGTKIQLWHAVLKLDVTGQLSRFLLEGGMLPSSRHGFTFRIL